MEGLFYLFIGWLIQFLEPNEEATPTQTDKNDLGNAFFAGYSSKTSEQEQDNQAHSNETDYDTDVDW